MPCEVDEGFVLLNIFSEGGNVGGVCGEYSEIDPVAATLWDFLNDRCGNAYFLFE